MNEYVCVCPYQEGVCTWLGGGAQDGPGYTPRE